MKDTIIKNSDLDFDIVIMDSLKSQIIKCIKKTDYVVVPQLVELLNVQIGSIRNELSRMIADNTIKTERKAVKLKKNGQFKTMTAYSLVTNNAR